MTERPSIQPVFARKILKKNPDVGKVSKGVPILISYITEIFIEEMISKLPSDGSSEIKVTDIIQLIKENQIYDFLQEEIPKLEQLTESESTKKGKPRNED